jgi:hypothetical protein
VEIIHVGDIGTILYLPTVVQGVPLDETLELFTTRIAWLMRPAIAPMIEISDIPTEIDPLDNVRKLKLVTGTETGTVLTGTGNFALLSEDVGDWLCTIALGNTDGYWSDGPFRLFRLQTTLPLAPVPLVHSIRIVRHFG